MSDERVLDESAAAVQSHLTILQNVIQRMAANSAYCKGWSITLVSAVLVIVANTDQAGAAGIALIPALLFMVLDMYYLGLERGFRGSYNAFIDKLHSGGVKPTDLYIVDPQGSIPAQTRAAFTSFAIWPFYGVLVLMIAATWLLLAG